MARSSDGIEVEYSVHGTGHGAGRPVVVLVHGWTGDRTYWDQQIDVLAQQYEVVTLDLGGHGRSGTRRADWSMESFGEDVVAVVDEVTTRKVLLVGHSMGGDAIVHAAVQLGDRVAGLVWIDTYRSLGNPAATPEQVEDFLRPFRDDFAGATGRFARSLFSESADPAVVERVVTDMAAMPQDIALGALRYAPTREPVALAALHRIGVPVIAIIAGTGASDAESMQAHGVEVVELEELGHFAMLEDPERFNPVLLLALAQLGG